jgi:hypothetical protein
MAQYIKQGDIFGRIGSGVGQGLAAQLPEEITRGRLSAGLKNLGNQEGLTPFQQFSGLASLPGATPQMIQSGSDLLRQQAYLNALKNQYEGPNGSKTSTSNYTPTQQDLNQPVAGEIPSLANAESTGESYKTYIPPTEQQERNEAYQNFQQNPARYNNDFNEALKERKAITARNQEIQQAYQNQEKIAVGKEEKMKDALDKEVKRLGIIPIGENSNFDPKLYQMFEEKILNSVLSKKEGGEGLTQEQAIKKYSDQLLTAYENYKDLDTLSSWSPREFNRRSNAIQKNFKTLGQPAQKIMKDKLITKYQVSPLYAAHKAYPIGPGEMPTLNKLRPFVGSARGTAQEPKMTNAMYSQLKKEMGKNNSPLSVAYELREKDRDPRGFLDYLDKNRDDLEVWQANEIQKNINLIDLNDMWLRAWE